MSEIQMTPFERRAKARIIRTLIHAGDEPMSMTAAAKSENVSRAWAYRILQELHAFEQKHFKESILEYEAELERNLMPCIHGCTWKCSHAPGETGIDPLCE